MRQTKLDMLVAEMDGHEFKFKDIRRAKYAGNFHRNPSLKRFVPMYHMTFLDFKDTLDTLVRSLNSRNHSKKKFQLLLSRANTLNRQWDVELRHYFT